MRAIATLTILSVVLIVARPWLAGFLRSVSHTPPLNETVSAPRIDVETAPSVVSPGEMVVIHVRVRDADRCRLAWRDTKSRDIPETERSVSLDGTVRWRLRVPDGLRTGSRALVVTAERGRIRSRTLLPVHVLDEEAARAHAKISPVDLPDHPVVPEGTRLAGRFRAAAVFMGIFTPDEEPADPAETGPAEDVVPATVEPSTAPSARSTRDGVREIDLVRPPGQPAPAGAHVTSAESGMLGASVNRSPDTEGALFDRTPADETSAAS